MKICQQFLNPRCRFPPVSYTHLDVYKRQGYSSLGLLKEFEVDALKLDRIFFLDIENKKAKDVIGCLIDLAKKLHVAIVAEGIEDIQQADYLKQLHCDFIQGYVSVSYTHLKNDFGIDALRIDYGFSFEECKALAQTTAICLNASTISEKECEEYQG